MPAFLFLKLPPHGVSRSPLGRVIAAQPLRLPSGQSIAMAFNLPEVPVDFGVASECLATRTAWGLESSAGFPKHQETTLTSWDSF